MTRRPNPGDYAPEVTPTKLVVLAFISVLFLIGLIFSYVSVHLARNLPSSGSIGSLELNPLGTVLAVPIMFLSFFLLYQFFMLHIDR